MQILNGVKWEWRLFVDEEINFECPLVPVGQNPIQCPARGLQVDLKPFRDWLDQNPNSQLGQRWWASATLSDDAPYEVPFLQLLYRLAAQVGSSCSAPPYVQLCMSAAVAIEAQLVVATTDDDWSHDQIAVEGQSFDNDGMVKANLAAYLAHTSMMCQSIGMQVVQLSTDKSTVHGMDLQATTLSLPGNRIMWCPPQAPTGGGFSATFLLGRHYSVCSEGYTDRALGYTDSPPHIRDISLGDTTSTT